MADDAVAEILKLLDTCTREQKEHVFSVLRQQIRIHPVESDLNTNAELILEAVARDRTGLTFRMLRGVIAEAAFESEVLAKTSRWENETPDGDGAFDYLLTDSIGSVRLQVKLQRSKEFRPMTAKQGNRRFPDTMWVVETQKTRGGLDTSTGEPTRSYRFGEFDILAVSLQPSAGRWDAFIYTPTRWLLPDDKDKSKLLKFQPVATAPNDDWTDSLDTCVEWFRSGAAKTISY